MALKVAAPVRCPDCRSRLTTKARMLPWGPVRWCKKCRRTVSYDAQSDGWFWITPMRDVD